jgi:flagellar hook-basal body complex protein FliE
MQIKADQSIQKMVSGEITDVHQVMTSVEEANVAFNMMMEIRNKVLDAYQEVSGSVVICFFNLKTAVG